MSCQNEKVPLKETLCRLSLIILLEINKHLDIQLKQPEHVGINHLSILLTLTPKLILKRNKCCSTRLSGRLLVEMLSLIRSFCNWGVGGGAKCVTCD